MKNLTLVFTVINIGSKVYPCMNRYIDEKVKHEIKGTITIQLIRHNTIMKELIKKHITHNQRN